MSDLQIKSVRLTGAIREAILDSALRHWDEGNPKPDLLSFEHDFAMQLWTDRYGEVKPHLDAVPSGFLSSYISINVQPEGRAMIQLRLLHEVPLPKPICRGVPIAAISNSDERLLKHEKLVNALDDWKQERKKVRREIEVVLNSVNTTKQLAEIWPEIIGLVPTHILNPSKGVQLPAIPMGKLNEKLGLADV